MFQSAGKCWKILKSFLKFRGIHYFKNEVILDGIRFLENIYAFNFILSKEYVNKILKEWQNYQAFGKKFFVYFLFWNRSVFCCCVARLLWPTSVPRKSIWWIEYDAFTIKEIQMKPCGDHFYKKKCMSLKSERIYYLKYVSNIKRKFKQSR